MFRADTNSGVSHRLATNKTKNRRKEIDEFLIWAPKGELAVSI